MIIWCEYTISLNSVSSGAAASKPKAMSDLPKRFDCAMIKDFFSHSLPCLEEPCPCRLGKSPLEARGIDLGRRGWHYNIAGTLWTSLRNSRVGIGSSSNVSGREVRSRRYLLFLKAATPPFVDRTQATNAWSSAKDICKLQKLDDHLLDQKKLISLLICIGLIAALMLNDSQLRNALKKQFFQKMLFSGT